MNLSFTLSILVNSCDSYEDCWEPFFFFFLKYGGGLTKLPIVLNTETKGFQYDGLNIVTSKPGRVEWGKRYRNSLCKINTKYVLVMLDDFFIREDVDYEQIEKCIEYMESNKHIGAFSFDPIGKDKYLSKKYKNFCLMPRFTPWRCNTQATIWRKDVLLKAILNVENPWEWEKYGSQRNNYILKDVYIFTLLHHTKMPINYGLSKISDFSIIQGKWLRSDVEPLFNEHDIKIDLSIRGFADEKTYIDSSGDSYKRKRLLKRIFSFFYNPFRLHFAERKCLKSENPEDKKYLTLVIAPIKRSKRDSNWNKYDYKNNQ